MPFLQSANRAHSLKFAKSGSRPQKHTVSVADPIYLQIITCGLLRYLGAPYPQGTQALHHHLLKRS